VVMVMVVVVVMMMMMFLMTQVMIIIVVIFVVCQTPAFVNQLVYVIGVADSCGHPYYYYYHFSNIIVSANSAVNFVVYCVFRRQFRRRLRCRQFRRRLRQFCGCGGGGGRGYAVDSVGSAREPWPPKMNESLLLNHRHRSSTNSQLLTTDQNVKSAALAQLPTDDIN